MDMQQCDRCGENNQGDAGYCGTCGLALPSPGDVASLLDDTTPGAGPGAAGFATSEYVSAPVFGETGPVSTPAPAPPPGSESPTVAAPPHTAGSGPPPNAPAHQRHAESAESGPPVRSSNSTSMMIAALAVAVVVIVGGVFILLSTGSETTRTADEDVLAPTATSEPIAVDSTAPLPIETLPIETLPTETLPAPTIASPPSTAVPVPTPTAPAAPSRGAGDLGLTQPILDEACDGRYITFVGSAVGDQPHAQVVSTLLEQYPGTNYIWTKSCSSLRQEFTSGADIYGVVFGPYATQQEACDARRSGPVDAYVRRISTFDPQDHTILC